MGNKWVVYKNHIALETDSGVVHPRASEIYGYVTGDNTDLSGINPSRDLSQLRFSKIGAPLKCDVVISGENEIVIDLYAMRKGKKWPVDMIDGKIIDHCVGEGEWFYLTGDIETIQNRLKDVGIVEAGKIQIGQYIDLIKEDFFSDEKDINNKINSNDIKLVMDSEGEIPEGIIAQLYQYQKTGYIWMLQMLDASHGCILGDEMGLGKTLQVITVFQALKSKGEVPFLVVAPVSLLENWKRECAKFAPTLDVFVHHGSQRTGRYQVLKEHDVVVISYNTAVSDLSLLRMIEWKCVVLDEAQNIKNPNSERAKSTKAISRMRSIAVTGTPFENHVSDIWSIVDFVIPGLLGSLSSFSQNVSDDVLGAEKIEPILSPIMIRRQVADVANDLPEKVIIPQPIQMSEVEKADYELLRKEAISGVDNGGAISLGILQKLRMFCTHRRLCREDELSDPAAESVKYQRFCEIVEEIKSLNEKVIVFTSYKKMFEIMMDDVKERFDIPIDCINGETPVTERQRIVDTFNELEGPAMLVLNPRAAGTGLNITGANHVIHYNLEWNPALEDQSSARAYRRGQVKTVFIYRLFYIDTVEQIVNERIERKRSIAATAIVGTDGNDERNDILRALKLAPELQKKGDQI